jgi:hypothetical protein
VRLLLDTDVMLWQLSGERSLGERARETIAAAAELAFSVVSFAEIGVKRRSESSRCREICTPTCFAPACASLRCHPTTDSPSQAFRYTTAIRSTGFSSPRLARTASPW